MLIPGLTPSLHAQVVVYSSMMRHNIEAGLNAVLPGHRGLLRTLMDREMNKPEPNAVKGWDTIRDMKKVSASTIFCISGYKRPIREMMDNDAESAMT